MRAQQARLLPWLRYVQVAGTLALSLVLVRSIDWSLFGQALAGARWGFVGLAALLLLLAHVVNIARWSGLLPAETVPLATLSAYYGAGLFSSNFLPTGVGGDGVRAALVGRHIPLPQALLSVALDRGVGLGGLGFFVLPALWLGLPAVLMDRVAASSETRVWLLLAASAALLLATAGGALLVWKKPALLRRFAPPQGDAALPAAGRGVKGWLSLLATTYLLSVWSNLATIGAHWAILQALGLAGGAGAAIWVVLAGSLSMLLPISINGLGVLESVFIVVLAAYGAPAPAALAAALLSRALGMLFSLLGGLLALRAGSDTIGRVGAPR